MCKYKGCLFGFASGDALGAPVEFLSQKEIHENFGEAGITTLEGWGGFPGGTFTCETQLAIATAQGCIKAYQDYLYRGTGSSVDMIYDQYLRWLKTQDDTAQVRHPKFNTLNVLKNGKRGSLDVRINNEKSSDCLARAVPVGLAFPPNVAFREGAEYSALTHGNPTAFLSAGFISEFIAYIIDGKELHEALELCMYQLSSYEEHEEVMDKVNQAITLSSVDTDVQYSIQSLGQEWKAEESLSIGIYCALKFSDNFRKGVISAVNHSGDSCVTGAITGAIIGAYLGSQAIPVDWMQKLERAHKIYELADDMYRLFQNGEKVSYMKYRMD
jgi:ADP-ribosylglycohydrolase